MATLTRDQLVAALGALGLFEAASTGVLDNMLKDGATAVSTKAQVAALTAIATADATDEATAITLVNECKAKINAVIAALKA